MLRPVITEHRRHYDLGGFWDFRPDPEDTGIAGGWTESVPGPRPIAVPASWNDQLPSLRDFLGPAWYQTAFRVPAAPPGGRIHLRFDSVNYLADAWVNGRHLGSHEGGHLPFSFDATDALRRGVNSLVVRVDGRLAPDRVPPGNVPPDPADTFRDPQWPPSSFDFFPFCGIQRPVRLCVVAGEALAELEVDTDLAASVGIIRVRMAAGVNGSAQARVTVAGHGTEAQTVADISSGSAVAEIRVPHALPWSEKTPALYDLTVELLRSGTIVDSYTLAVGIRTVRVDGDCLLLNGEPLALRGFGRHEDFPVVGRGLLPAVIIRDFEAMRWVGANSFRTTHYPYSEEMMDLADRLGFLVIDEIPAVGLFFSGSGLPRRLELCTAYVRELIARDRNRPSVIAWSVANEPHSRRPEAGPFFRQLYDVAKAMDPSRPVTVVSHVGEHEEAFSFCDLVCLNRYYGWYSEQGRIDEGCRLLSAELDALHRKFRKPILLTEFGADAVAGCHAEPPEMFSEEYQAQFIERYSEVLSSKPFVVGHHVWNLCDFKTGQEVRRVGGMNLKGVFTRDRRPKMAAHLLRRLWGGAADALPEARPPV